MIFFYSNKHKHKMALARKSKKMTTEMIQNAIRLESKIKGAGWFGWDVSDRPTRFNINNLELGWTAWRLRGDKKVFWYNVYSDTFQNDKPIRSEYKRRCPGCNTEMDPLYPSQYCSRSCMYDNI